MSGRKNNLRRIREGRRMVERNGQTLTQIVQKTLTKLERQQQATALERAADEMPIETLHGADKASQWLRERAARIRQEAGL
ncbi:hypothetical protein [Zhihengliuella halotolerans]|uniref:hypothetical protein n=1 Tax=Zhihengliuella halotolerans TaxID=370736 RepID=UPI000C80881E|nr:hypothetical protein [Zhihengliuella halotolerans]